MLEFECILVYLKYWTLILMPLMVYPKVLCGVDIHRYIQCLAAGVNAKQDCCVPVCGWSVEGACLSVAQLSLDPMLTITHPALGAEAASVSSSFLGQCLLSHRQCAFLLQNQYAYKLFVGHK